MWEQLTPADIQRVKHRLALMRAATLSRHAEELKSLAAQQDEIEIFERMVGAFTQKYMGAETTPAPAPSWEQPAVVVDSVEPSPEVRQHAASVGVQVREQLSTGFGTPPRLRRFNGG